MEDYYEYLDSNGVTTLYKLIKDDTVALIDSYSVTINGITTNLDNHVNNADIHTPIADIEGMIDTAVGSLNYATPDYVDTKVADLVNSSPETLDTLKELSDALGNDSNFATTVANQIGSKANKDDVYTKGETDTLLDGKANSVHSHVVSDITDFPTIPTKTSQLINDSGFLTSSGGLITSVSWNDITDKPNFSTVATSGSYTDLSNTPTIPTKVSQLENDMGFGTGGDTSDCVHKTGDENIAGNKLFEDKIICTRFTHSVNNGSVYITGGSEYDKGTTLVLHGEESNDAGAFIINSRDKTRSLYLVGRPDGTLQWAGQNIALDNNLVHKTGNETINGIKTFNNHTIFTQDMIFKNNYIDLTVTPSSILYSNFIFRDKNNQSVAYIQYAKRNADPDILGLFINDKDKNLHGIQITSNNYLLPFGNNIYNFGSPNNKWANAYIANTYTNRVTAYSITHPSGDNNSYFYMSGGSNYDKGATLYLGGISATNFTPGRFALAARKTDGSSVELAGSPDGSLTWGGKSLAIDENLVHRSGNEAIKGVKYFDSLVYLHNNMSNKNNQMDLFTTPANTLYAHYMFVDKNNEVCAYMQYGQQNHRNDFIGLFIHDKNRALHGIQVTTNNEVIPISYNTYSLGTSSNIWSKVYATNTITNMVITYAVTNHNDTSSMTVCGGSSWDKGSTLFLYGNSHANYPGAFDLTAKNTTNEYKLIGFPNGALTWGGKNLTTTTFVKGTNYWYRKHSDGFIEMGGIGNASIMESTNKVTLPTPFSNTNYVVTGSSNFRADVVFGVSSKTTTYFYCGLSQPGFTWATGTFSWYACGY